MRVLTLGVLAFIIFFTCGGLALVVAYSNGGSLIVRGVTYLLADYALLTVLRVVVVSMGVGVMFLIYKRPTQAILYMPLLFLLSVSLMVI